MRIRGFVVLLLGISIVAAVVTMIPRVVQAQTCTDATGAPAPCPNNPNTSNNQDSGRKKRNTPTSPPPTQTPTSTPTSTATATPTSTSTATKAALVVDQKACPSPAAVVANVVPPTAPAGGNPGSPFPPGLLGGGGLLAGFLIGLLVPAVRKAIGNPNLNPGADVEGAQPHMNDGSDKEGAQPHMNDGSDQGIVIVNSNNAIGNPNLDPGSDKEGAQPHMNDGSDQAIDFRMKGPQDIASQFHKADDQFLKYEDGGEQL